MPGREAETGWAWLEAQADASAPSREICRDAAVCFSTPAGRALLGHLEKSFLSRRVPPTAPDAVLRHVEGQRSVVAHLLALRDRGREGPDPSY